MKVEVHSNNRGYVVTIDGREYSYNATEQIKLMEDIGKAICERKVKVQEA